MKCAKLRTNGKLSIKRDFARSRLDAEYLAKAYEIIVPIYKREYPERKKQNEKGSEKVIVTYQQFGVEGNLC